MRRRLLRSSTKATAVLLFLIAAAVLVPTVRAERSAAEDLAIPQEPATQIPSSSEKDTAVLASQEKVSAGSYKKAALTGAAAAAAALGIYAVFPQPPDITDLRTVFDLSYSTFVFRPQRVEHKSVDHPVFRWRRKGVDTLLQQDIGRMRSDAKAGVKQLREYLLHHPSKTSSTLEAKMVLWLSDMMNTFDARRDYLNDVKQRDHCILSKKKIQATTFCVRLLDPNSLNGLSYTAHITALTQAVHMLAETLAAIVMGLQMFHVITTLTQYVLLLMREGDNAITKPLYSLNQHGIVEEDVELLDWVCRHRTYPFQPDPEQVAAPFDDIFTAWGCQDDDQHPKPWTIAHPDLHFKLFGQGMYDGTHYGDGLIAELKIFFYEVAYS